MTLPFKIEDFTQDPTTRTLRFVRRIVATPERLFSAWTDPAQVTQWWDPEGQPLADCSIDLRVGGTLRFVNQGHEDHPFQGQYTMINPPHGFIFTAMGATGTVSFTSEGPATRMEVTLACASDDQFAMFLKMGIAQGTARTLDNLCHFFA